MEREPFLRVVPCLYSRLSALLPRLAAVPLAVGLVGHGTAALNLSRFTVVPL